jgi:hypothetical protein
LHDKTTPFWTLICGGPEDAAALADTGAEADAIGAALAEGLAAATLAGGASGARRAEADAAAADDASPGALGPIFTPNARGHATPMTNPTAAMTPTFTQPGLSFDGEGTSTASGASLRIRLSFLPNVEAGSEKPWSDRVKD